MSTLVVLLRVLPLVAFAAAMWRSVTAPRGGAKPPTHSNRRDRAPLVAHVAALGVYGPSLWLFSGSADGAAALWLAASGALLGVAGVVLVVRSRAELGPAWSFVPKAGQETGFVTTGPYRLVRHPIYLGLILLALGEALAVGSWPAVTIVLVGIIPTFAWRARVEETLLGRTFGDSYTRYRTQTKMLFPHLL